MAKTLAQVDLQVRQLIGDYQRTNFTPLQVTEAINWAQNAMMRIKGFKLGARLFALGGYPTGTLPHEMLVVKRVQLVTPALVAPQFIGVGGSTFVADIDSDDSTDTVVRVLDESTIEFEDSINELWRTARATFKPRRWSLVGNLKFTVIPPIGPTDSTTTGMYVRLHYIKMATPVVADADTIDPSIPDYYQEALRYLAVAYLMETDTDLKSIAIKKEMAESFGYHMAGGVQKLATPEQDS
jgi:hypothetical protein